MDKEQALDFLNTYHPICDATDRLLYLVTPEWESQGCGLCPLYRDGHCYSERAIAVKKTELEALSIIQNAEQAGSLKPDVKNSSSKRKIVKQWRRAINDPSGLLTWAKNLSEQKLVLSEPVCFMEGPLRPLQVTNVSEYAAERYETIYFCRGWLEKGSGWGFFTHDWWLTMEKEAMNALITFREEFTKLEGLNNNQADDDCKKIASKDNTLLH
jgi:hypothetical protein